ncbi:ABC transporter ATP-binding protein [Clostridium carnis]
MAYIEIRDAYKRYKIGENTIIANNGIDFSIEKGEFVIILGPSGAGKTTVLNILGGMDTCDEGKVIIDEVDISKFNNKQLTNYRRYDVGFVFQFYNLVQNLTAKENVELATQITKDALDVDETLKLVGLSHRKGNFPSQLSGGEQQRVAIARAIAKNPKLLLCDEPTGALDYKTGKQILKTLQDTCKNTGTTVIVITHNSALAPIADRVIKIKDAKVRCVEVNEKPALVESIEW